MATITPDLLERARGCLLGAAVGNAFGMALEGTQPRSASAQLRELRPGRLEAGQFSADIGPLLTLGEALAAGEPLEIEELAGRLRAPLGKASTGRSFLGRLSGGKAKGHAPALPPPDPASRTADACALIQALPIALASAGDRRVCLERMRSLSRLTHPHPDCLGGAVFLAAMVWHLLHGRPFRQALQQSLRDCAVDLPVALAGTIEGATGRVRGRLKSDGLVPSTLETALWSLGTTVTYAEAVTRAANVGGRAGLSTAVAGALAGAAYQRSGVPADWRTQVHGIWPPQGGRLWREGDLVDLAGRLVQAATRDAEKMTIRE